MKSIVLIVLLLAAAGYFYLQQKPTVRPAAPVDEAVTQAPAPEPAAKAPQQTATANPGLTDVKMPVRHLAPEGVLYATQRISVVTDSGVASIAPETKLTVVRSGPPLRVTDGKTELDAAPGQVTNDLDVAVQIHAAEVRQQARVVASVRSSASTKPLAVTEAAGQAATNQETEMRRAQSLLELRSRLSAVIQKQAAADKVHAEMQQAYNSRGTTYNGRRVSFGDVAAAQGVSVQFAEERSQIEAQIRVLQQ